MGKVKVQLDHIRFFVNEDFKSALNCFNSKSRKDNNKAGCFSLLRIIFPLIDHVAQLVEGKSCKRGDSSKILKKYIHSYIGEVNPKYKDYAGLLVYMYRHGLLHQLQPNRVKYNNAIVEWNLYYREHYNDHLLCKKEGKKKKRLYFNIEKFAEDFLKSIKLYEGLLAEKKNKSLRGKFNKTLLDMHKPLNYKNIPRSSNDWLDKSDFSVLAIKD